MSDIGETFVRMEPEAAACGHHVRSVGEAALVSIAVSVKRIADAIDGDQSKTGIHELLWQIEQRLGPQS